MSEGYIDLALSEDEQRDNTPLMPESPKYPYGASFSLDEKTLDKVDHEEWAVDDLMHFHVMAKITGINSHENKDSSGKCVNFQIVAIKGESETAEDTEEEQEEGGYHKEPEDGEPSLQKHGYLRYK